MSNLVEAVVAREFGLASWQDAGVGEKASAQRHLETVAANLDAQLKEKGWDGKTLATKAGIDPGQVSRYLGAKRRMTSETLEKVARALGIDSGVLIQQTTGPTKRQGQAQTFATPTARAAILLVDHATRGWPEDLEFEESQAIVVRVQKKFADDQTMMPITMLDSHISREIEAAIEDAREERDRVRSTRPKKSARK